MSSRSSLMFLSVNGTAQSFGVIPERSPIQGATPRMLLCRGMSPRADTQTRRHRLQLKGRRIPLARRLGRGHVPGRYRQARILGSSEVKRLGRTYSACAPRSSKKLCPGVSDVSHPGRLDRLDLLELRISHGFEQPSAACEQDRDDRDDDLVEQTRCEVLLRDGRPAPERHLLLSGCCPRLVERRLDPVRDEVERRSALHLQRLARMASEDEDGMVEGRIVSPPALP